MKSQLILIVILLMFSNRIVCYSQTNGNYEWQIRTISVDSLPKNISLLTAQIRNMQKSGSKVLVGVSLLNLAGGISYKNSRVYETKDSGKSFQLYSRNFNPDTVTLNSIFMFDSLRGYVQCDPTGYLTNDGGHTWVRTADSSSDYTLGLEFRDNVGVRNFDRRYFLYTVDNGKSWIPLPYPDSVNNSVYNRNTIHIVDSNTFFSTRINPWTYGERATKFYLTTDRGNHWQNLGCTIQGFVGDSSNNVVLDVVKFLNEREGVAIGNYGYVGDITKIASFKTHDAGRHWYKTDEYPYSDSISIVNRMYRILEDTLVYVHWKGWMKISYDRGETWHWLVNRNTQYFNQGQWQNIIFMGEVFFYDSHTAFGTCDVRQDGKTDIVTLVPIKTTNVEHQIENSKIENSTIWVESIYPVPSSRELMVVINLALGVAPQSIETEIYDILGNVCSVNASDKVTIQPHEWGGNWYTLTVPIQKLSDGVYIIRILAGEYQQSRQFIHLNR